MGTLGLATLGLATLGLARGVRDSGSGAPTQTGTRLEGSVRRLHTQHFRL